MARTSVNDDIAKQAAQELFMTGLFSQTQIAETLHISEKSITRWKKEGEWERRRTEVSIANQTSIENIWKIVKHTSDILAKKSELLASEDKVLSAADQDGFAKLFKLVKGEAFGLEHYIRAVRQLIAFVEPMDLELSKRLIPIANQFIAQKQRDLQ